MSHPPRRRGLPALPRPVAEFVAESCTALVQVVLVWCVLGLVLRPLSPAVTRGLSEALGITNLPATPSLFNAALLLVICGALARRLRAAMLVVVVVFNLPVLLAVGLALIGEGLGAWGRTFAERPLLLASAGFALITVVALLLSRRAFPARLRRGAWWRALLVLLGGLVLSTLVARGLLALSRPLIDPAQRWAWAVAAATGTPPGDWPFRVRGFGAHWVVLVADVISGLAVLAAVLVLLRGGHNRLPDERSDELEVRRLLLQDTVGDSLGYFATRDDRDVVLTADHRAGVSFKVVADVALAAGDPLGPPEHWNTAVGAFMEMCRRNGWAPAVVACTEAGAKVYRRAGASVRAMGDEAIIETRDFDLARGGLRQVRQSMDRLRRAGVTVRIRRQAELSGDERAELAALADEWRHGEVERGFSMALERLGAARDPRLLVVTAHRADATPVGLLTFAPWGRAGASLDTMRRAPDAPAGVTELMVATLAREGGLARISLNFAMFRSVFVEGEDVGATWSERALRRVMLVASRWLQLESLYTSNQKYLPRWRTRYLAYDPSTFTQTVLATLLAEGFLPVPDWARPTVAQPSGDQLAQLTAEVLRQETAQLELAAPQQRLTEQQRVRRGKLAILADAGRPGYPVSVPHTHRLEELAELPAGTAVSAVGRVVSWRDLGGICFAVLRERSVQFQMVLESGRCEELDLLRRVIDLGDQVSVTGVLGSSRSGQPSVLADRWQLAAKALTPPPPSHRGLVDPESKVRLRHMDLALDEGAAATLRGRSSAVWALRSELVARGYIEVETPVLQAVHGGANARPFRTHINAYDVDLYLRIAPELFLKRLMVGGMDRVFELGRNFRNEGADATHNPEFTSLEAYQAFGDYTSMRHLTRELILAAAVAVHGEPVAIRDGRTISLAGEWPVVTVHGAVSAATGEQIDSATAAADLRRICAAHGIEAAEDATPGALVTELYDELVEGSTELPTFYTDFPVETSPLTRVHRDDPRLAERWDLVAFGAELGTAYSELIDPIDQRDRLVRQSLLAAAGDPEAMEVDEEFLAALEFGMPPTGGLGLGVDRVYMMLIGASIRETLAFPFVRPQR